jgi:hypothetical protein
MAFIFTASDGIYTGASINVKPAHAENCVLVIKSTLKTAGWLLMGNGDGNTKLSTSTTFGTPAIDVLTTTGTGAVGGTFANNSISNGRAWFVVQQTATSGSWCFQNMSTAAGSGQIGSTSWRIKYSSKGFDMTTATSARVPAPIMNVSGVVDEAVIIGGGTDASPTGVTFFSNDGVIWANCVADNAAPFGWYYAGIHSASARNEQAILYEPLVNVGPGDIDPYTFMCRDENSSGTDAWNAVRDNKSATALGPRAFIGPLVPFIRSNSQCCAMIYTTTETNATPPVIPTGCGTNAFTGNEDVFPIVWAVDPTAMVNRVEGITVGISTQSGQFTGYKGIGTMTRFLANSKSLGDVLTGSLMNIPSGATSRMVVAPTNFHLTLPWSGSVVNT